MELKTPLYDCHVKYGGKIVPFAGYLLPVQYKEGLIKEHNNVRTKCGLFDVSHMSEIFVEGKDALKNIQMIFPNDYCSAVVGQIKYTPMLNDNGGIVDDMIIYKFADDKYLIVGNGANRHQDFQWIKSKEFGDVNIHDDSDEYAQVALQGPASTDVLKKLMKEEDIPAKYYTFVEKVDVAGMECIVSQTGYTGEMGYEIYIKAENATKLWEALMEAGEEYGIMPCGLGARDTLRLEASMPLYGHEMSDDISPILAGLKWAVKLNKEEDFVGKQAILAAPEFTQKLVGLKITGKGIAREHNDILVDGKKVGETTSGTHAPFLGYPIAMAYLDKEYAEEGTKVIISVRGRDVEAEVIKMPFYKRSK